MIDILRNLTPDLPIARTLHRFRHRVFIEHAGWDLPCEDSLEIDAFDTPTAVHFLCRREDGQLAGQLRLLPTTQPYMIQTLWPDLMGSRPMFCSSTVWEVTRLGVDPGMSLRERGRTVAELVTGCLEYGMAHGIGHMLAVMSEEHAQKIVAGMGWDYSPCGPFRVLGDTPVMAVQLDLSPAALANVRRRTKLTQPVCREVAWREPELATAA